MTLRLTDQWVEWIEDFLPSIASGENVRYELTMALSPEGAPAVCLVFFAPGPLLGTTMHSIAMMPNPGNVTQENIQNVLRGMKEALAAERTKQLTQMAQGPIIPPNGGPAAPGGPLRGI